MVYPSAPKRSWQPIFGAVLVAVGLIIAIIAVFALSRPSGHSSKGGARQTNLAQPTITSPSSSSPANPTTEATASTSGGEDGQPESSTPSTSADRPPVIVLNNTRVQGLAATAGADLRAAGWTVTATDNYQNDIASTAAYYDPSDPANQGAALQMQEEFPWIRRVVPRFQELPAGPIVLVLTAAY